MLENFIDETEVEKMLDVVKRIEKKRDRWIDIDRAKQADVTTEIEEKLPDFLNRIIARVLPGAEKPRIMAIITPAQQAPQAPHADYLSGKGRLCTLHLKDQEGTQLYPESGFECQYPEPDPNLENPSFPLSGAWRRYAELLFSSLMIRAPSEWESEWQRPIVKAGTLQVLRSNRIHRGPGSSRAKRYLIFMSLWHPDQKDPFIDEETTWTPWNAAFQMYGSASPTYHTVCMLWAEHKPCSFFGSNEDTQLTVEAAVDFFQSRLRKYYSINQ